MPEKIISKQQIEVYMNKRKEGNTQNISAAKAGFSERSARNVENRNFQVAKKPRDWRTRKDKFANVWDAELAPMLNKDPGLQAITLLEFLQDKYIGEYPDNQLRSLQRKVRLWKATNGPAKEIIFRQKQVPGWQSQSDFTHADELDVTIKGEAFSHMLYHFRLTFSGVGYAKVILGGESFTALSEGLQNALERIGGSTKTHRTDSLSAAFKNFSDKDKEDFTDSYKELCEKYGMEPTRNNKGVSHENGMIESSHRHLKSRLNQALMIRGSRDFSSIEEYSLFVNKLVEKHNNRNLKLFKEEQIHLKDLPLDRSRDFNEEIAKVTRSSTINVRQVTYSVPAKLIGMTLRVHLYDDRLKCYLGSSCVHECSRIRWSKAGKRPCSIDHKHLIPGIVKKPQAFRHFIYQEHLFPTPVFKEAWLKIDEKLDERTACKEFVSLLKISNENDNFKIISDYITKCLESNKLPSSEEAKRLVSRESSKSPKIEVDEVNLNSYDSLLQKAGGAL